jgi:hypothetical protein
LTTAQIATDVRPTLRLVITDFRIYRRAPDPPDLDELRRCLDQIIDLLAVSQVIEDTQAGRLGRRVSSNEVSGGKRTLAARSASVIRLSYNSPLEIVLQLSVGASALLVLARQWASTRAHIARKSTEVQAEKVKEEAYLLLEQTLRQNVEVWGEASEQTKQILNNAASSLISTEKVELLDDQGKVIESSEYDS